MNIHKIFAGILLSASCMAYCDPSQKMADIDQLAGALISSGDLKSIGVFLEQQGITDPEQQDIIVHTYIGNMYTAACQAYDELYTHEEIRALLAFFSSPVGMRFIALAGQMSEKTRPALMSLQQLVSEAQTKQGPIAESTNIDHVTDYVESDSTAEEIIDQYKELISAPGITVVKCTAVWCGPCRVYKNVFNEVADTLTSIDDTDVSYIEFDVDCSEALASELEISSIPTTLVYKDGVLVARENGALSKQILTALIKSAA